MTWEPYSKRGAEHPYCWSMTLPYIAISVHRHMNYEPDQ